jgi:hypothetical protein
VLFGQDISHKRSMRIDKLQKEKVNRMHEEELKKRKIQK